MQLVDMPEDERLKAEQENGAPSALPKIISTGFKVRNNEVFITGPLGGPSIW
jgi:hypothetical protein